ncbi:MAG TPA: helix-turn-helix domain-containing protein [Mycobacteriales bacterium]|nr:helix-turn-helix domain-containing protein [Mycobacteriales bacterium]
MAERPAEVDRAGARPLTDPREIRAIAHPVRLALLEALSREGPLTATQAAEIVDESPANCSFHFRTLAKYGFVEEVPGGTGRARPWRRIALGQSIDLGEPGEVTIAGQTFAHLAQERTFDRVRHYIDTLPSYPKEWQQGSFITDWLIYVTADELAEIGEAVMEQLSRYRERTGDLSLRPEGSRPVQVAAFGFPLPPTASGN